MGRVVAVANQKGGVGKTTTVHSLGFALAELGRRVLLVDLDPQACLTYSSGINPDSLQFSLYDVFERQANAADIRRTIGGLRGLEILPTGIDLGASEISLLFRSRREYFLSYVLRDIRGEHDVILIDCPPSLGVLTINALTAAEEVLIPFQCEALSTRGVEQLLETIDDVRTFANADLQIRGVIATMYNGHTHHARAMLDVVKERHRLAILDPPVPKSIRFAEAPQVGRCILEHAPSSPGADAYRLIARDLDSSLEVRAFRDELRSRVPA